MLDVPGNWQGAKHDAESECRASWERRLPAGLNRRVLGDLREDFAGRGFPEVYDSPDRGTGGKALGWPGRCCGDLKSLRILTFALLPHVPTVLWDHSSLLRYALPRGHSSAAPDANRSWPRGHRFEGRVLRSES